MTLRIIVRTNNGGYGANIGGPGTPYDTSYRTFDIAAPELEEFLREYESQRNACIVREVVGAEVVAEHQ